MAKFLHDSAAVAEMLHTSSAIVPWRDSSAESTEDVRVDVIDPMGWENVIGLEDQQRRHLQRLQAKGVLWKNPEGSGTLFPSRSIVFRLTHGGDVDADGNCLFSASKKAMSCEIDARQLRRRTVKRFLMDLVTCSPFEREAIDEAIKHMYSPDLRSGWGVHVVQEHKLLAKKDDRDRLDAAIDELILFGMPRELAAESVYRDGCLPVDDGPSWSKYMSTSGCEEDEDDIITLQYTVDGLLSVDENREGRAAAFGDDMAIECLATEFKREIFVVQAHGSDAMVEEDNCVFFLPHRPRCQICEIPIFLFMKGTGWCGAGADHYEPLVARPCSSVSHEKVALVL